MSRPDGTAGAATSRPVLLQACLNGSRRPGDHPALPLGPDQLAEAAAEAVAAGATALHVHQRDADGLQTLAAEPCARTLEAIRAACPGVPVGLTTGAWIEPDPERRLELVAGWRAAPDYASVNLSEDGSLPLVRLLLQRGIGVEAGLWTAADAEALLASGLADDCLRLLLEAMEPEPAAALANVAAMERLLDEAGCQAPQLQHGEGAAAWPVLVRALEAGRDVRIGLEDTLQLPDGRAAAGNGELVAAAARLAREAGRRLQPAGRGR
jgi:uncharacterized protein (DUF849 family)